jgi:hypothetical protein
MEAAIKECPKCRAEVFQGACFCMQCGTRLQAGGSLPSSVRLKAAEVRPQPGQKVGLSETGYSHASQRTGSKR